MKILKLFKQAPDVKHLTFFIPFILLYNLSLAQSKSSEYSSRIDSLLQRKTKQPFNGIILITQNGRTQYEKHIGYEDLATQAPIKINDQFVIGSISKQFTAVMTLREFEKGNLKLHVPIHVYLPELNQSWADTVTVHQLLTHTHGIISLDEPTAFKPGTKFLYSNIGYVLLSKIIERTSGESFDKVSMDLFKACGLKETFHPEIKNYQNLVNGYTEEQGGVIAPAKGDMSQYVAAGGFISSASDLVQWNKCLYEGKILSDESKKMMTSKQKGAVRDHPVFGLTEYGYGITVKTSDYLVQYGHTGLAAGFASMNFYFPETKVSVIILENIAYGVDNMSETFFYHTRILEIVRQRMLVKK